MPLIPVIPSKTLTIDGKDYQAFRNIVEQQITERDTLLEKERGDLC